MASNTDFGDNRRWDIRKDLKNISVLPWEIVLPPFSKQYFQNKAIWSVKILSAPHAPTFTLNTASREIFYQIFPFANNRNFMVKP